MNNFVFACIAPHGSLIIPVLAGETGQKALATRTSMEELGRCMAAADPETIIVLTPHGHRVDGSFTLLNNQRVRGELNPNTPGAGHPGNGVTLEFDVDQELNTAIIDAAHSMNVPVTRLSFVTKDDAKYIQTLDWGVSVPLWFLGATLYPLPKVVIACADHGKLPWELFPHFGVALRKAVAATGRRVALLASADMGHAHDKNGPYGFDPVSAAFDAATVAAVKAQDLGRLLTFDHAWVKQAATDAYGQILTLHGALEGTSFRGRFLSYEVPTYFGMMCVAYEAHAE